MTLSRRDEFAARAMHALIERGGDWRDAISIASSIVAELDRTAPKPEPDYRARKDEAYTERNRLVALLARLAISAGLKAGKRQHEDVPGEDWDPEWRTLVAIDLPTGQVSWHFHDRDAHLVADLTEYSGKWDGHDTAKKYERVSLCRELAKKPSPRPEVEDDGRDIEDELSVPVKVKNSKKCTDRVFADCDHPHLTVLDARLFAHRIIKLCDEIEWK